MAAKKTTQQTTEAPQETMDSMTGDMQLPADMTGMMDEHLHPTADTMPQQGKGKMQHPGTPGKQDG